MPTKIGIDTKSGYVLDTANYHDLVILNGGVRYDDYNVNASGYGTVRRQDRVRPAAGRVRDSELQPRPDVEAAAERQRLCRLCDLGQSGRRRIRRHQHGLWRPLAGPQRQPEPDLRAGEEQGGRDRHQVGAVRSSSAGDRRPVPDQQGERARGRQRHALADPDGQPVRTRQTTAPFPASRPAPPITSAASISAWAARSPTNGAFSAGWC